MEHILLIKTDLQERSVPVPHGLLLLNALREAGFQLSAPCGGNGLCGKCRVLLDGNPVLACQTLVADDATVCFPEQHGGVILGASAAGETDISPEFPEPSDHSVTGTFSSTASPSSDHRLALAVDLGTTTVAVELIDMDTGTVLGTAADWNAQAVYGADVITRCQYCMEHPDGVQQLQSAIQNQICRLVRQLGASQDQLQTSLIVGNTVMQHLHAGLSPVGISVAPFRPETLFDWGFQASDKVSYSPCVSGYVGGDITAGLLASGLTHMPGRSLFLDIGTNGEMALGGQAGLIGCAVASGPAFEGVGISCGMPGIDGAVSHVVWKDADPSLNVIGGGRPRGICGSGLIDLLAVLLERHLISGSGLLYGPEDAPAGYESFLGEDENGNGIFYLTSDHSVFLTAADVRNLQLAKAAVAAGVNVLLHAAGIAAEEVDHLMLSGGFGNFMDVHSAAAIGMFPACLAERVVHLGNSALTGARSVLLHPELVEDLYRIQRSFQYLELSGNEDFNREYPEQMIFYEEDDDEWN